MLDKHINGKKFKRLMDANKKKQEKSEKKKENSPDNEENYDEILD